MASSLSELVQAAFRMGASDIHLESGSIPVLRVNSQLQRYGDETLSFQRLKDWATDLLGTRFKALAQQRSIDISESIAGVRCRLHVFYSFRGLSYAIRLLSATQVSFKSLNLHPNFLQIIEKKHGLVIVSGPTGSGKSSTIAAMIHEINQRFSYNIVTIEQPIEYFHQSKKSFVRQREVGRDTLSFDQALIDSQDPDVIVVGEMREPETMKWTLNAAETGHLVLTTMHASTVSDCLSRLVSAFPAETQANVRAQLADSLVAVVCQKLVYQNRHHQRAPVCEMFFPTTAGQSKIRQGEFNSIHDSYYAGRDSGCMTDVWYQQWLDQHQLVSPPKTGGMSPNPEQFAKATESEVEQLRWQQAPVAAPKLEKPASSSSYDSSDEYIIDEDDADDDLWKIIENLEKPKSRN